MRVSGARSASTSVEPVCPAFDEPWQAQIFSLVDALKNAGVIDIGRWSQTLGAHLAALPETARADDADARQIESAVWTCWVCALEQLLLEQRIAAPLQLTSLRQSWAVAAEKTPHGEAIVLGALAYRWAGLPVPAAPSASARAQSPTSVGPA